MTLRASDPTLPLARPRTTRAGSSSRSASALALSLARGEAELAAQRLVGVGQGGERGPLGLAQRRRRVVEARHEDAAVRASFMLASSSARSCAGTGAQLP